MEAIKKLNPESEESLAHLFTNGIRFTGSEYRALTQPCVYAWRRYKEYLYVGKSKNGIARTFSAEHHIIDTVESVLPDDCIELYFPTISQIKTIDGLDRIEANLIKLLAPKYNQQHNREYEKQTTESLHQPAVQQGIRNKETLAKVLFSEVPDVTLLGHACCRKGDFDFDSSEYSPTARLAKIRNQLKLLEQFNKL